MNHLLELIIHFLSGQWLTLQMPWKDLTIVPVPEQAEAEVFYTTIMKEN